MSQSIKLQTSAILHVPLDKYTKDFTFIVNGEAYKTSKFVADLLSTKISKYHSIDPTINEININTEHRGNFEAFLRLQNFDEISPSEEELNFLYEIIKELETSKIELRENRSEITIDNVVDRLLKDEKCQEIFQKHYDDEIEFISTNFSEILQDQREKLAALSLYSIERIIANENLQLENEDELLKFVNELYCESQECSILYGYVYFCNVEASTIEEFLSTFNVNDMNQSTWDSISTRLKKEINNNNKNNTNEVNSKRYKNANNNEQNKVNKISEIEYQTDKYFEGIFKFLRTNSNIKDEVKITASSVLSGNLEQVIKSDYPNNDFYTNSVSDSWVRFEFIKRKVIPTHYTLRSNNWSSTGSHLRNWVFEGSVDSENWEKLDSQKECSYLRGANLVHTFAVQNKNKSFKYFRIYQTGKNWFNNNYLCFNCFELYGEFEAE